MRSECILELRESGGVRCPQTAGYPIERYEIPPPSPCNISSAQGQGSSYPGWRWHIQI